MARPGLRDPAPDPATPRAVIPEVLEMRRTDRDDLNMTLVAMGCAVLMLVPLVTTFDDFLTSWALQLGVNNPLQSIVPVEARMVVSLLGVIGVRAAAAGSDIVVWDGAGSMHTLFISWNCIGWQSLILLGISFFSGLRGRQALRSRLQVIVIGACRTMLLNLARLAMVAALEATWGRVRNERRGQLAQLRHSNPVRRRDARLVVVAPPSRAARVGAGHRRHRQGL